MSRETVSGLLVGPRVSLQPSGGGVQVAVREYLAVLERAGFTLHPLPFDARLSLTKRMWNRLSPRVMPVELPAGLLASVEGALGTTNARFVFFCPNLFPGLSRSLRERFPAVAQVLLSVGVESLDFCIDQQIRRRTGTEIRRRRQAARMLGQQLLDEAEQRGLIDSVLTLSPLEVETEKWLGAPRALWVPRIVMEPALVARPVDGRVGCVSTLDHPPNRDGLVRVFEKIAGRVPAGFRFRLAGRPASEGRALAAQFPFVEYLGALDDAQLRAEAATWCCFVHPLFVYAKGCSTKLAVGLGWGLPVATTEFGARGYRWDERVSPLARTPEELAAAVIERSRTERFSAFQSETRGIVAGMPAIAEAANEVRRFLLDR